MPELNDAEIQALIAQLDDGISREGAVIVEGPGEYYDEHENNSDRVVTANRRGYLRLGVAFLKAALAEPRSEVQPHRIDVDLPDVEGPDAACYTFERKEDVSPADGHFDSGGDESFVGWLFGGGITLFFLASLAVGAFTILGWLLRLFF